MLQQEENPKQEKGKKKPAAQLLSTEEATNTFISKMNVVLQDLALEDKCAEMKVFFYQQKALLDLDQIFKVVLLENQKNLSFIRENMVQFIDALLKQKLFDVFLSPLFKFLQLHSGIFSLDYQHLRNKGIIGLIYKIKISMIPEFIDTFQLQDIVDLKFLIDIFYQCLKKKKYEDSLAMLQTLKLPEHLFEDIIATMDNYDDCTQAGQFILAMGHHPDRYPGIKDKQQKKTARYYYKTYPPDVYEEALQHDREILLECCNELDKNGFYHKAASIIVRQNLLESVKNQIFKENIYQDYLVQKKPLWENRLFVKDFFGPSDKLFDPQTNYLTSAELGFPLEKLSWVDNDQANEVAWGKILQAPYVGLDTEFSTGKISLCKTKSKLAVVQIATPAEVFLFDGLALAESKAFKLGVQQLFESQIIKIGHTIKVDLDVLLKSLQIPNANVWYSVERQFPKVLDISQNFNQLMNYQSPKSSLEYVCEKIIGKPLSKLEQRSDWLKRPLRQAQLHYAAMDAIVCLRVYEMKQEVYAGQIKN